MSETPIYPLSNSARQTFCGALRGFSTRIDAYRAEDGKESSVVVFLIGLKPAISEMIALMEPGAGTVEVGGKKISADDRIGELYEWADRKFIDEANKYAENTEHPIHRWYATFAALGPTMNRALPSVSAAYEAGWRSGSGRPPMPIGPVQGRRLAFGS